MWSAVAARALDAPGILPLPIVAAATVGEEDAQVGAADSQQAMDTAAQRQITRRLLQKATAASSMPSPADPFMFGTLAWLAQLESTQSLTVCP